MYILNEQEENFKKEIEGLIEARNIDLAKKELSKHETDVNKIVLLAMKRKIAKAVENRSDEKRLIDILLELEPDNVKLMSRRIKLAREDGDLLSEKKCLDKLIELEPDNLIAIGGRAIIAKKEGDLKRAEKLGDRILEINPNHEKFLLFRINIAIKLRDLKTQKKLLQRYLNLVPNDIYALTSMGIIAIKEGDYEAQKFYTERILELDPKDKKAREWERRLRDKGICDMALDIKEVDEDEVKNVTCVTEARQLIYGRENINVKAEQIKELVKGIDETKAELILAELYFASGIPARAEKSLKAYKKKIEQHKNESKDDIKVVNKAIELVKGTKTKRYDWDNLWDGKQDIEQDGEERY